MYESLSTKKQLTPPGLIPEFNALGNHPENMEEYLETHVRRAYERLGIADKFPETKRILCAALKQLIDKPPEFTGHHVPTPEMKEVAEVLMENFLNIDDCGFMGRENFEAALRLREEGNNILLVQNHTSPLDALVPLALIRRNYGDVAVSLIMSQVFEYGRITNLMTSGADKFPVFQPKHIKRFENKPAVVTQMNRQNIVTLRALSRYAATGGKMIFLYPERNRNTNSMGVPEPAAMGIPDLLAKSGRELYILPTFVNGLDSIFPNSPGRNEVDDFFEIIKIGQGNFYCGEPIKYADIVAAVDALSDSELAELAFKITGEKSKDEKVERKAAVATVLLGLIAALSPEDEARGIYNAAEVKDLTNKVTAEKK
jgi:hypothetical protein